MADDRINLGKAALALVEAKGSLRLKYRTMRSLLPQVVLHELSQAVAQALAAWLQARQARQVLFFYPVHGEVDLLSLAELLPGVRFALPVLPTRGKAMNFAAWEPDTPMVVNRFGIPEPRVDVAGQFVVIEPGTVLLVPCLALDAHGTRLGYGGGFYDRYLAEHAAEIVSVGVILNEFCCADLPREGHDIALQYGATELGVMLLTPG